jgi:hypothetical protein
MGFPVGLSNKIKAAVKEPEKPKQVKKVESSYEDEMMIDTSN